VAIGGFALKHSLQAPRVQAARPDPQSEPILPSVDDEGTSTSPRAGVDAATDTEEAVGSPGTETAAATETRAGVETSEGPADDDAQPTDGVPEIASSEGAEPEPVPPGTTGVEETGEAAESTGTEQAPEDEEAVVAGLLVEARKLYKRRRYEQALARLDEALVLDPARGEAHVLRANVYLDRNEIDQALVAAEKAISLTPDLADAYLTVGVCRQAKGELDQALVAYRRYVELDPSGRYASSIGREIKRLEKQLGHEP
jgi:tetratricopeptide (TPR) repeat protein